MLTLNEFWINSKTITIISSFVSKHKNSMKYIQFTFFFVCLFLHTIILKAQQNHFIYIQTENKQPFYIKMNKRIYSSSASGYLILAKLKPDVYDFFIGFPKNEWGEQNLECTVVDKDLGYLLKNYGNEGWGLQNLQTLAIVKASGNQKMADTTVVTKTDSFSNMLSSVVNDPTIKEVQKPENSVITVAKIIDPPSTAPLVKKNIIVKERTIKSSKGLEMVYLDSVEGVMDTINILIPAVNDTILVAKINPDTSKEVTNSKRATALPQKSIAPAKNEKFLNIELPNPLAHEVTAGKDSGKIKSSPILNSDCKDYASENDFLKLRKKMASVSNTDMMIVVAKKVFKTKCFTTEQVKNLSVLFLYDEGKYAFFDAMYPFVSDTHNFSSLQDQLTVDYFINRFKVMLRH